MAEQQVLCSLLVHLHQVLKWGTGDAFDFAVLLTSYLTGVGYNAYVVYGYAPAHITLRDQSHTECPVTGPDDPFTTRSSNSANAMTMTMKRGEGNNGNAAADDRAQNKYGGDHHNSNPSHSAEAKARPCTESKYLKVTLRT